MKISAARRIASLAHPLNSNSAASSAVYVNLTNAQEKLFSEYTVKLKIIFSRKFIYNRIYELELERNVH